MVISIINDIIRSFMKPIDDYFDYGCRSLLSKKISLEYGVISEEDKIFFRKDGDHRKVSLILRDSMIDNIEESDYWHSVAKQGKKAKFDGYYGVDFVGLVCKPHRVIFLKGYISVPEDNHKMGICIGAGNRKLKPDKEPLRDDRLNSKVGEYVASFGNV